MNEKLWNKNFFLLWQGQIVSFLGDAIYLIALDFYVLDLTGSTAIMGLLTASSLIPKVILSPIAGVYVDRLNLRNILVVTDFIRGIFVLFVGIMTLTGQIEIWMIFLVAIINSFCSAFFGPAAQSLRPKLVSATMLTRATSLIQLGQSGSDMIGNAIGGLLYVAIGPAWMFIFNGGSYLFSALSELFISYNYQRQTKQLTFKQDFKVGIQYLFNKRQLRNFIILSAFTNFFFNIGIILIIPYFKSEPSLGVERYGYFATAISLGMITSSILLSSFKINRRHHYFFALTGTILFNCLFIVFPYIQNYYLLLFAIFIAFIGNMTFNSLFSVSLIEQVDESVRGKVFALIGTINGALTPIGILIGGVLGEVANLQLTMSLAYLLGAICAALMIFNPYARSFFNGKKFRHNKKAMKSSLFLH